VETYIQRPNGQGLTLVKGAYEKQLESFANWRGAFFADFQLGIVRAGPAAGIRFLQYMNPSHQRIFLYASWKL
jgi:hypothetical protein